MARTALPLAIEPLDEPEPAAPVRYIGGLPITLPEVKVKVGKPELTSMPVTIGKYLGKLPLDKALPIMGKVGKTAMPENFGNLIEERTKLPWNKFVEETTRDIFHTEADNVLDNWEWYIEKGLDPYAEFEKAKKRDLERNKILHPRERYESWKAQTNENHRFDKATGRKKDY